MNNSVKCPQCGLVNFANNPVCRRCGSELTQPRAKSLLEQSEKGSRSRVYLALIPLFIIGIGFWFFYAEIKQSVTDSFNVDSSKYQLSPKAPGAVNANRLAGQQPVNFPSAFATPDPEQMRKTAEALKAFRQDYKPPSTPQIRPTPDIESLPSTTVTVR